MSSVGSPFLFLAPPTPSAGRLFTPVKTGTAASPEISKPGTPKTPGTSIRRRQDIRYYGVGFSQRSTPGNRRPGPMRGAGASYVRGNAVRPQSSLFETMDLQGNEPPIVFNTTTSTSVPVVSLSGPRPTAWNAASEDDTDGQMATNLGANSAAVPGFPLRGSPTTAGTAAQVIQRVIQETSPPGRSNDALGTRMPRVLPINPYMVTDGDESVAKAPLLSIKVGACDAADCASVTKTASRISPPLWRRPKSMSNSIHPRFLGLLS